MLNVYWNTWEGSLITLTILWFLAFMIVGTIISIYLAMDNNKWCLLLSFFSLPLIGLIICLIIMQKKYKIFDKFFKKLKKKYNHVKKISK